MATRKSSFNWDRIELEYLAGEDSVREIADRHEISEGAIRKRAKAEKMGSTGTQGAYRAYFNGKKPRFPTLPPRRLRTLSRRRILPTVGARWSSECSTSSTPLRAAWASSRK